MDAESSSALSSSGCYTILHRTPGWSFPATSFSTVYGAMIAASLHAASMSMCAASVRRSNLHPRLRPIFKQSTASATDSPQNPNNKSGANRGDGLSMSRDEQPNALDDFV